MARPIFEILRELRAGRTLEDLGDEMARLVAAVKATGKSGELKLTLKLKPPKSGVSTYLLVEDQISTKMPVLDRGDTVFFPTADGGLSRQDPSQGQLDLRAVPKNIDPETGEIRSAS